MNELVVKLNNVTPGSIDWNQDEISKMVNVIASTYSGMIYETNEPEKLQETIKQMKDDRAKLNKAKDLLDSKRKEAKTLYTAPLDVFESSVKNMVSKLDDARNIIDQKVKEIEEAARKEKREKIRAFYDSLAVKIPEDYKEALYGKIYNPSWENVTATKKAYVDGITEGINKYEVGMDTLNGFDKYQEEGIKVFKNTLDINAAISEINNLVKREEEILAREKARIEEEARKKAEAEVKEREEAIRAEERAKAKANVQESTPVQTSIFDFSTETTAKSEPTVEKVIGIRVLAGAVMDVYCTDKSYKVVILDEDTSDTKEKVEFSKSMADIPSVY